MGVEVVRQETTGLRPFVNRHHEREWLEDRLARTQADGHPRLARIVGEAGMGKTSLVREFRGRLPAGTAFRLGRCLSYGRSVTYSALADVRSGYGEAVVVHDVTLAIERSEIFVLLGKNGMGKSTLLKTVMGFLPKLGGTVTLFGEERERWE